MPGGFIGSGDLVHGKRIMALTRQQEAQFRKWMIKSFSVPLLALPCIYYYWPGAEEFARFPAANRLIPFHFLSAAILLFGGFPLWNVILEKDRLKLFLFHGVHFLACFAVLGFFYYLQKGGNPEMPAPAEFCLIIGSWCLAKEGLSRLMPDTNERIESFVNWRQKTLKGLVKSHYYQDGDKE
jgi:hypothetical protein